MLQRPRASPLSHNLERGPRSARSIGGGVQRRVCVRSCFWWWWWSWGIRGRGPAATHLLGVISVEQIRGMASSKPTRATTTVRRATITPTSCRNSRSCTLRLRRRCPTIPDHSRGRVSNVMAKRICTLQFFAKCECRADSEQWPHRVQPRVAHLCTCTISPNSHPLTLTLTLTQIGRAYV